jgi:hypothetical protein
MREVRNYNIRIYSVEYSSSFFFVRLLSSFDSRAMKLAYHSCRQWCVCVCVCVCVYVCVRIQALDKRVPHSHSLYRYINNKMRAAGLTLVGNRVLHFVRLKSTKLEDDVWKYSGVVRGNVRGR